MRLTLVGLLLFASTALGQTVTFSATGNVIQNDEIVVSAANCTSQRTVTFQREGRYCDTLYLWLSSDSSCTREPAAADVLLQEIAANDSATSGSLTFTASQALVRAGATCESQTTTKEFRLCASTKRLTGTIGFETCADTLSSIGSPTIDLVYDPEPPAVPEAPTVTGLDGALGATVKAPSDASLMVVEALELTADADGGVVLGEVVSSREQTSSNTAFRLEGLENGVEYAVRARAIDAAGNTSEPSPITRGTPIASNGFYGGYLDAGGAETGGCSAAGGSLTGCAMLVSLGIWLSSRRKRS
ncbi:MXAN_2561 family MXYO-CTERM-anchored protein [Myxococcus sp. Y35]|uniref:MXAN_2561 family MXYO-CTERM-anchored protein n=1 Tax=Pseudomyxococcus flavus TaxID=3115648 RepID=UPI003CF51008